MSTTMLGALDKAITSLVIVLSAAALTLLAISTNNTYVVGVYCCMGD